MECTECAEACDRRCAYHEGRLRLRHIVAAIGVAVFLLAATALILPAKANADTAAHPYGGCKEAYTMPHSEQAKVCSGRQYLRIIKPYNRAVCHMSEVKYLPGAKRASARLARAAATAGRRMDHRWWVRSVRDEVDLFGDRLDQGAVIMRRAAHADTVREWVRETKAYIRVMKPTSRWAKHIRVTLDLRYPPPPCQ